MPLHKPLPQSENSAYDTNLSRQNSHYRRRTLQTVRELTAEDGTPNDTFSPETKTTSPIVQTNQRPSSRSSRRRSLPHDGNRIQRATSNTLIDHTTPFGWGRRTRQPSNGLSGSSSNSNSNQFSGEFTSTNKPLHRQVSNLKPRRHSLPPDGQSPRPQQSDQSQTSQLTSKGKGKQPIRAQDVTGRSRPEEGSNVKRERDTKKREQELVEARMRREKERRGLLDGSLSTLPSLLPLTAKPNEIYIRSRANQQQLHQNSRTMDVKRSNSRLLVPRPSVATIIGHTGSKSMNAQLLKTTGTNNSLHMTAHYDPAQRQHFTNSTPTGARILRAASQRQSTQGPPRFPTPLSRSLSSSAIPTASQPLEQFQPTFPYPTPATALQDGSSHTSSSQERSSRWSSVGSTTTTTTSPRQSRMSSSPHPSRSGSRREHGNGVTKEHVDDPAASPPSTPTPDGRTHENTGILETRQSRPSSSLRSPSPSPSSFRHLNPLHPEYRSRSRANSGASHYSYVTPPNHSTTVYDDGDASPQIPMGPGSAAAMGMGSENMRLLKEKEKMEFEKREKLRRANEMMEEKMKVLDEKGNKGRWVCGCLVM